MSDQDVTEAAREKALQDVQTIKSFLESGQKTLEDNGFHFMFWGVLIPIGALLFEGFSAKLGYDHVAVILIWPLITFFGAIISVVVGRSFAKKKYKGNAFIGKLTASLWLGILIVLFVMFFVQFFSVKVFEVSFVCMISVVLGLGYWFYGSVIQLFWFKMVGPVWWLSAIVMSSLDWNLVSPIMAGTAFLCSFIPGLILFRKRRSLRS